MSCVVGKPFQQLVGLPRSAFLRAPNLGSMMPESFAKRKHGSTQKIAITGPPGHDGHHP